MVTNVQHLNAFLPQGPTPMRPDPFVRPSPGNNPRSDSPLQLLVQGITVHMYQVKLQLVVQGWGLQC